MNRLIKKDQYGDYMPIYHKEVCDKLYALEELEQDLGCTLDEELRNKYIFDVKLFFKDYKKTWWLKEDKSE